MSRGKKRPPEYIDGVIAQRCCVCKQVKHLEDFPASSDKKLGRHTTCRICNAERSRRWNRENPERAKAMKRAGYLKSQREHPEKKRASAWRRYGIDITPEEFKARIEAQAYCCAICGRHESAFKKALAPDHDHQTGAVRGLLCPNCNLGLGNFKDSTKHLLVAIRYLENSLCPAK